jgi:tetratricopeptide (TPR) repeat protein
MGTRYFNWKLATVLLVATCIFAATVYALHHWQVNTRAIRAQPLGEEAYARGDWDEAAVQLGKYLSVDMENVDVLLKYGEAQLKRRPMTSPNIQSAVTAYRSVLRLDGRNTKAAQRLMEIYLWPSADQPEGLPGEAKQIADRYLEHSDDVEIRRLRADALCRLRQPEAGAAELTALLKAHPKDIASYEMMATLARQHPQVATRSENQWLDDAVAQNPDAALAYIVRAGFHLRRNNRDQALADLTQAQKCDLSDTPTRLRLVAQLVNANELDQARAHLEALQAKDATEPSLWLHWADLASRASQAEEMQRVAEAGLKALETQPWDFLPVATELLIRSDRLEEAGRRIAQMRQRGIASAATAFLEGLIADKQGKPREAIVNWRKALTLGYRQPMGHMMLAIALTRLGDTQSAIGQLRMLVTDAPNYVEGRVALAQLLVQTRDWPEALDQARQIRRLAPGHAEALLLELQAQTQLLATDARPPAAREKDWQEIETRLAQLDTASSGAVSVKLLQAQVALIRGKFPEAAVLLNDLESKNPTRTDVFLLQAELGVAQGRPEEAKKRFQDAVAKFPQAFEPVRGLALFLERQGQHQECEAVLKEGIARLSEPRWRRDLGLILAELYRQWKEEAKLDQWLNDLAVQFPNDIQPRRLLLTRTAVVQDPRKAQSLIEEIKTLEGEGGWQWRYEQARLWSQSSGSEFQTYYPQIVKLLQENLLANPKDHGSRLLLAATYEKANELALAVTTYREALSLQPNSAPILIRTILALTRAKEYNEARTLLDQAEQQQVNDPILVRLRMEDDLRRGRWDPAREALEKAILQDPNDTASVLNLTTILMQQQKYNEAQKMLDAVRARMPDSISVLSVQVNLLLQQRKAEEALRLCDQIADRQRSTAAYLLRARTHVALNHNEKALEDFGRIIALDPQKPESWATRADFYRTTGRIAEGIADVKQARALAPDNPAIQRLAVALFIGSGSMPLIEEAEAIVDKALAAFEKSPVAPRSPDSEPSGTGGTQDARLSEYTQLKLLKAQILLLPFRRTGPGVEEARLILREITNRQPKLVEAWQWLAQLELSQEEPSRAHDAALRGLAHNENNALLLLLKARAEKVRSPAIAALTLKQLLDGGPKNVEVVVDLADAYARAGRTQQAVDLLRQKKDEFEGPLRRRCEIAYAEALYAHGQRDEAKTLFEALAQAEPHDPTPTMTLAQQLRREMRWTEMNQLVRRWLTSHPEDADVATTIARVLAATGDRQALSVGEDLLRMTLERHPHSTPTLMLLSMMMQDAGRNEESVRLNRTILQLDPNNVIAVNNLAWVLCEDENRPSQYQEALALAEKGLKIVPDYVDLLDTRGYAHYRLGDFEKAVADFTRCVRLYPANSPSITTPRFHLAMTYAAMKRRTEATVQLRTALDLNRANLQSARKQADDGRVTYAIKVLKDALRLQEQMEPLKAALGLQGQANGPSAQEVADATALLDRLQKGNY